MINFLENFEQQNKPNGSSSRMEIRASRACLSLSKGQVIMGSDHEVEGKRTEEKVQKQRKRSSGSTTSSITDVFMVRWILQINALPPLRSLICQKALILLKGHSI